MRINREKPSGGARLDHSMSGVPWRSPGSARGPAVSSEKWPLASTATHMC